VLVVDGTAIIGHAGAVIVGTIAGGVFSGALAERRRERTIERVNDHFMICGYGAARVTADAGCVLIGVCSPNKLLALRDLFAPSETVAG
jgi:hypothetical protein